MSLTGTITHAVNLTHTSVLDLGTASISPVAPTSQASWTVTDGTSSDQMDLLFHDQRTLGAGANEELDLARSLVDAYGTTLTFVKVKLLYIKAASTNGSTVSVGGAAANAFTGPFADSTYILQLQADGAITLTAPGTGYTVTAGTGDKLKILNDDGGAGATYDIVIGGTSA